ncbi:MAG TPA: hypothetical protein VGJ48_06540 [Pyrinomonadaceae bacterium]|jgi:hypothetical protein
MIVSSDFTVQTSALRAGIKVHGRKNDPHCIYFNDPDRHQLQFLMPHEYRAVERANLAGEY